MNPTGVPSSAVGRRRPAARLALAAPVLLAAFLAADAAARPPRGRELQELAERYLDAGEDERRAIRASIDAEVGPLSARLFDELRRDLLKIAARHGPKLGGSGQNFFYDEEHERGRYLVEGKPGKVLFLGLHGGGLGSGDAGSMAARMGGGGWFWIFPEVLEKTEHGWTDSGTEEFVLALVEAAKRTGRVDPNRIYLSGHSMGGYGTWTLLGHHPDVFAGGAAYAGAPTVYFARPGDGDAELGIEAVVEGVLPNLHNSRLFVFQSTDDPNVPPRPNQFAVRRLLEWRQRFPGGFDFRYVEVDDRQHAPPQEGYLPTQQWVAEHARVARPPLLLWQPMLSWKRQYHWLYWQEPERGALVRAEAFPDENRIAIEFLDGETDVAGLSVLLGPPLVDLEKEVVVSVDGEERFRGRVERTVSTLLMTLPRNDEELTFDARVDL